MLLWKPVDGNATGTGTVMEMWMQTATGMWGQLTAETRLFGVSLTMGVWLMILYDMLRVFRAALPSWNTGGESGRSVVFCILWVSDL